MNSSRREFLARTSIFGATSLGCFFPSFDDWTDQSSNDYEKEDQTRNPYLHSIFAPVQTEETIHELKVVAGKIPEDIEGAYLRNGPNPIYRTDPHHWFDGDGMIHEVRIEGGKASYRNRFIQTHGFQNEKRSKRKLYPGLEELFQLKNIRTLMGNALLESLPVKDGSHTDVIYFQKKLISLFWLSGVPYELDPKTLETVGKFNIDGYARRHISAHARIDPETGELFCLDFGKMAYHPWVNVICINERGSIKWDERFMIPNNRVYHDILFTKNYVLLMDFPVGLDLVKREMALLKGYDARIVAISRENPKEKHEFFMPSSKAPYVLHAMNAFDENGVIKISACLYVDDPFSKAKVGLNDQVVPFVGALRVETRSVFWSLDLKNGTWVEEFRFPQSTEFPRVNDLWLGRVGSKFSYHPELEESEVVQFGRLLKYNWEKQEIEGAIEFSRGGKKRVCEEFVFIPKSNCPDSIENRDEDDGYLGSMIHTFESKSEITSCFEIYCAKSLEFVASIQTPRVPAGFHSKWIP
jgi:carotenoid cleavage dioxygenase